MKKLSHILAGVVTVVCLAGHAQTVPYHPTRAIVMTSPNGLPPFAPLAAASGIDAINYAPPTVIQPMCSATGLPPFSQCSSGSGGNPSPAAIAALPAGSHGFSCDESSTPGVPTIGVDYIRCDSVTHQMVASFNGGVEQPLGKFTSTLVGFWTYGEATGSTLTDGSQSGNNITLTGTTWVTQAGLSQGGVSFAGTSSSNGIASGFTNINFDWNQPFTYNKWFVLNNATSIGNPRLISRLISGASGGGYDIGFNWDPTDCGGWCIVWELANTDGSNALAIAGTTAVTTGALHHLFISYDGSATPGGVVIYLDNVLVPNHTSINNLNTTATNSTPPSFGGRPPADSCTSCYFDGIGGPEGLWNRVLTSGSPTSEEATLQANPYAVIN